MLSTGRKDSSYCNQGRVCQDVFQQVRLEHVYIAAMTTDTKGKTNSFVVQLCDDLNIDHPHCVDHRIQLAAKLAYDDMNFG
jgi:hypothetical protein